MDPVTRIIHMEQLFDETSAAVEGLSAALDRYLNAREKMQQLFDYYFGPEWRQDLETDRCGRLPEGLKRGVLSEDGVYNLFFQNRELLQQMKELFDQPEDQ